MKTIKKGDAVLIVGYRSVIFSGLFAYDVVDASDMNNKDAAPIRAGEWYISPGDVFLCKPIVVGTRMPIYPCDVADKKVAEAMKKRGYWWEVRLKLVQPRRSK